jgi:NAD/NADP transhydrogenase alpha subunit
MARRRQREQTIFFPWERGGGILRGRGLARAKLVFAALGMAAVNVFGGFLVTRRMLEMFKKKEKKRRKVKRGN